MQKMGHYVEVVTYGLGDDNGFSTADGISIKKSNFENVPVTYLKYTVSEEDLNFSIFNNLNKLEIFFKNYLENGRFNLVHVGHPMRLGFGIRAASSLDLPIVLTLTDFWLLCPTGLAITKNGNLCSSSESGMRCVTECYGEIYSERLPKRYEEARELINLAAIVVSPTKFLANIVKNNFHKDVDVVRHGLDYKDIIPNNKSKNKNDDVTFAYIGTVLPHKGVHVVVDAMNSIKNKNIQVRIYGNYFHAKKYYENLKEIAKKDNRIQFLGEYKDSELNEIMKDTDCILVPSIWWENSPLTVLISLAFKIPVITINVGGGAELVKNNINGFNFEIGNSNSLANLMGKIAENPDKLNKIKINIIRPPRTEEEAFEYENIYKKIV